MYGFLTSHTCEPIFVNAKKDRKKLISVPKRAIISQKKSIKVWPFLHLDWWCPILELKSISYHFTVFWGNWTSINLQYFLKSETDASNCWSNLQYFTFKEYSSIHQKWICVTLIPNKIWEQIKNKKLVWKLISKASSLKLNFMTFQIFLQNQQHDV